MRLAELHRWHVVTLWGRKNLHLHNQLQRETRPSIACIDISRNWRPWIFQVHWRSNSEDISYPSRVSQQLKKCNKTQGAIESLIEFLNMEEESAEEDNDTEDEMIFFLNQAGPFPACHFKYRLHSNFPVEFTWIPNS